MTSTSEHLEGRRVLVVGGRGFVGAHVVGALLAAGARVHLFGPAMPDRADAVAAGCDETVGSIADRDAIARALEESGATEVVSCAGYGSGTLGLMRSGEADRDAAMAVNVLGHGRLLEEAAAHGVRRVVWTSSTVVYGSAARYGTGRVDEDTLRAPETFYGLTKSLAEDLSAFHARRSGMAVVALRLPLILGPGLWYAGAAAALARLFEAARDGVSYRLAFHDRAIDLMHVADVAEAVLTALRREGPLRETYNLEGFTARAGVLIEVVRAARPGVDLSFEDTGVPPLVFPLISGARFQADTGFAVRHDRDAFVRAMLAGATPP